MIALVAWGWALIAIGLFLALGVLAALIPGAFGSLGDSAHRLGQTADMRRSVYRGVQLPDEVPEAPLAEGQPPPERGA